MWEVGYVGASPKGPSSAGPARGKGFDPKRPLKTVVAGADGPLMVKGLRKSDRRGIRISDADRDLAAERLSEALAAGRITITEFETRLDAAFAAVHAADLRQPLAELPGCAVVALPDGRKSGAKPMVLRAGAAGLKRTGEWIVPARMQVKGGMGWWS